ncbi:hypothetical protein GCM10023097_18340 [Streptomyces collinus]
MRQHQCLVTRELDRDLAIAHAHPCGSAPPSDYTNLLAFDLDQTHRGTPPRGPLGGASPEGGWDEAV